MGFVSGFGQAKNHTHGTTGPRSMAVGFFPQSLQK
jgi:hypothetical protein